MAYASDTYRSPRFIQRYSHRRRFEKSLKLIEKYASLTPGRNFLDFGCADGHLGAMVKRELPQLHVTSYDPHPDTSPAEGIEIHDSLAGPVADGAPYGIIGCFEVLEHLSAASQEKAVENIRALCGPDSVLIISVPVECGLPGVGKALFRKMFSRRLAPLYTFRNIVRTFLSRPIPEYRSSDGYLDHIGFYFRDLEPILEKHFETIETICSPFPLLGRALNSQIFAVLKPKPL